MKQITGPAKTAFERWFFEIHGKSSKKFDELLPWQKAEIFDWLNEACETIQHAFLIKFFDSVGIYIEIGGYKHHFLKKPADYWCNIYQENTNAEPNNQIFVSRQEATSKALERANKIFNNLNH